jgi:two-component system, chemotaxis family, CheB/CheR fusion protein
MPDPYPASTAPIIYIVDDDGAVRKNLRELLELEGHVVADFADGEAFLSAFQSGEEACLVIDANLPGMSGLALLEHLRDAGRLLPAIMLSGCGSIGVAVQAMKAGATDYLEKPASCAELIVSIDRALTLSRNAKCSSDSQANAAAQIDGLTPRQHQVMEQVLAGHPSKNIAADLHISRRTVENHRASIMRKTCVKSLPALARLAVAAGGTLATA